MKTLKLLVAFITIGLLFSCKKIIDTIKPEPTPVREGCDCRVIAKTFLSNSIGMETVNDTMRYNYDWKGRLSEIDVNTKFFTPVSDPETGIPGLYVDTLYKIRYLYDDNDKVKFALYNSKQLFTTSKNTAVYTYGGRHKYPYYSYFVAVNYTSDDKEQQIRYGGYDSVLDTVDLNTFDFQAAWQDPSNERIENTYNYAGKLVQQKFLNTGNVSVLEYDANGNLKSPYVMYDFDVLNPRRYPETHVNVWEFLHKLVSKNQYIPETLGDIQSNDCGYPTIIKSDDIDYEWTESYSYSCE